MDSCVEDCSVYMRVPERGDTPGHAGHEHRVAERKVVLEEVLNPAVVPGDVHAHHPAVSPEAINVLGEERTRCHNVAVPLPMAFPPWQSDQGPLDEY